MWLELVSSCVVGWLVLPFDLQADASLTNGDGQLAVVRLYTQEPLWPLDGPRWWVAFDGRFHRIDSFGFESNAGPLYQSPDARHVLVFRTFRNTLQGGLRIDFATGLISDTRDTEASLQERGWIRRDWRRVDEAD